MLLLMLNILWAIENSFRSNLLRFTQFSVWYSTLCNLTIKNDEKQIFLFQLRLHPPSLYPLIPLLFKTEMTPYL